MKKSLDQFYAEIAENNIHEVYNALENMEEIDIDMPTWKGKKNVQIKEAKSIMNDKKYDYERLSSMEQQQYVLLRYVLEAASKSSDPIKYAPLVQKLSYKKDDKIAKGFLEMDLPLGDAAKSVTKPLPTEEVESYLESINFFYKKEKEKRPKGKSEEYVNVFNTLSDVSTVLRRHLEGGRRLDENHEKLPNYEIEGINNLRKKCNTYFQKHGIENTKDNKDVRDAAMYNNRVYCSILRSEGKTLTNDSVVQSRVAQLQEQLKKVAGSVTGNSKEFTAMQDKLNVLAENPSEENYKALQDAAKQYMEQKGNSKRSTSKGQLRYDIANDLYNLGMDVTVTKTTSSDLDRIYQETFQRERKTRVKAGLDGLQGKDKKKDSKKTAQVKPKSKEKEMEVLI